MMNAGHDPRSVANLILDRADQYGLSVSNLALQKLLYFAHGFFLTSQARSLVAGYFEAWRHGPVHPAVYHSFKAAGEKPISFRAVRRDPLSGVESPLPNVDDPDVEKVVAKVLIAFGDISPGRLVELSHAKGAPWDYVVSQAEGRVALALRIPDNVIRDRFKHHKVTIGPVPRTGEPLDDSPLA